MGHAFSLSWRLLTDCFQRFTSKQDRRLSTRMEKSEEPGGRVSPLPRENGIIEGSHLSDGCRDMNGNKIIGLVPQWPNMTNLEIV